MRVYIYLLFVAIVGFTVSDVLKEFIVRSWNEQGGVYSENIVHKILSPDDASFTSEEESFAFEVFKQSWKSNSVLRQGTWKKISTSGKGIYRIPYAKLTEWGFSNPSQVKVFGNGAQILSENPGEINYDDLEQCAVWHGNAGGTDCILFYAPGNVAWKPDAAGNKFIHKTNDYAVKGYFFLAEDAGSSKAIETLPELSATATHELDAFDDYKLHELDLENVLPLGSGKKWYGEKMRNSANKKIDFELDGIQTSSDIQISLSAIGRSFLTSSLRLSVGNNELGRLNFQKVNTGSHTSTYASERSGSFTISEQGNNLELTLKYYSDAGDNGTDNNANAWLDFIEINYRRKLSVGNEPLFFRDLGSVGVNNIAEFNISNASSATQVFDVTEINNVKKIPVELAGSNVKLTRPADELREYVVFDTNGSFPEPELIGEVENQDLHSMSTPDFVIITHPVFWAQANELAQFHRDYDGMQVEVVTVDQVYNEFSSGTQSATGIRNFLKMFYDRDDKLKYVLLFGDGSYDNRGIKTGTTSFIPTFQSENSLNPVASFVTDDYFVLLDDGESVYDGTVDLGIGRIPASTPFQAEVVVQKIKNYHSPEALGDWRNIVCFIGDDEDGNLHMSDSEKLAGQVNDNYQEFKTDKIYLDAYQQESTPGGERYPDVTEAINQRVKDGVLVLNYVGHANERFMADEHVLDISDINSWSNSNNLPIFVTATCEFSRFDADDLSAGEYILFNPNGGGIGLFSTTRLVFAYSNFLLSKSFYNYIFEMDESNNRYRLGDIIKLAKVNTINTTNKRNFSLLADPALRLSYPKNRVVTTRINGKDATNSTDTIGALRKIDVEGYVADYAGNRLNNFTGEINITVYDKEMNMSTLGNGGEKPMNFKVRENIIYKGVSSVSNGDFSFSFVVPKDISYDLGEGKIMYYAKNESEDAHGAFTNFVIGGGSGQGISDNTGPDIDLYMNSTEFVSGDKTGRNPVLLAYLSDENGINTVGTGIGHDITAILDNDYSNVMVLNNFYQSDIGSYTSGVVQFPLRDLAPGVHTLKLKAWDVANNSSEAEIEFEVTGEFSIHGVSNYPNPVQGFTYFTFEHSDADAFLDVVIEIADQRGSRVGLIETRTGSNGTTSLPVRWDLSDSRTYLSGGVYIYRIFAQNESGVVASRSGKLIVSR